MAKLYVHRNLHRSCWSVLLRGKLLEHRNQITLREVEFRVRPGGHARAIREGKRNVHAFGVGTRSKGFPSRGSFVKVRYNISRGCFLDPSGREITGGRKVLFRTDGAVKVFNPRYARSKG